MIEAIEGGYEDLEEVLERFGFAQDIDESNILINDEGEAFATPSGLFEKPRALWEPHTAPCETYI